jgi:hypothetical protein
LLSDPKDANKLTHMLVRCMGEERTLISISAPLIEWDFFQVSKHKRIGREFKMIVEIEIYEMNNFKLDLGYNVNIFPKKYWDLMGKPNLLWSPA